MSTCLLSVVIDVGGSTPRLYQVLYLNPNLVSGPCSYHDGLSPSPSLLPSLSLPPSPDPVTPEPATLPSYPHFLPSYLYSPTTTLRTSDIASDLVSTTLPSRCTTPESDDVFVEDLPCSLTPPPNLTPSSEVTRKWTEGGKELRLKLLRQRSRIGDVEPASLSSSNTSCHNIARGLIPAISVAGVASPFSTHNVQFAFDNVLEFWKSFEYVKREHASTVSLSDENDGRLNVSISDAVSELETVKFTIQTKTQLPSFSQHQMSVIRCHEEFIWLHDMLSENPEYAGYIIPPAPPKPDFEEARDKLTRVTAAENTMTEEEYKKLRKELESDYLALFKKTVAMHEIYLLRIAAHSKLREDSNFRVFLEYAKDLKVRSKNKKEIIGGFFKSMTKNVDEALLSGQKDKDEFFIERRSFLEDYHNRIKETTKKSEGLSASTNGLSVDYMQMAGCLALLSTQDPSLQRFMAQGAITFESLQKLQKRTSTDEDLKLTDLFKYYQRETNAAKSLLYRRGRALADKEIAEGKLEQAQKKFKDIPTAEAYLEDCKIRFESISDMARTELDTFTNRRLETYRRHLVDMSELQIRHSQSIISELTKGLELLKEL